MDAQVIPPSDWINFYPPSAARLAALAVLKREQVTRAEHTAMDFPFGVGALAPKGRAAFAPDPGLVVTYKKALSIKPAEWDFGAIADSFVSDDKEGHRNSDHTVKKDPSKAEIKKVRAQVGIVESVLRLARPFFKADDRLDIGFDFDNGLLGPDHTRAPGWHPDHNIGIIVSRHLPMPRSIGLVFMMRSYEPTEMMQGEWRQIGDQLCLHPKAQAVLDAQMKFNDEESGYGGWKERHWNAPAERLARHERAWRKKAAPMQKKIDRLTEEARREGLVVQGQPYELTMASTLTAHRTHRFRKNWIDRLLKKPSKPAPSSFMRLIIERYNPAPRP